MYAAEIVHSRQMQHHASRILTRLRMRSSPFLKNGRASSRAKSLYSTTIPSASVQSISERKKVTTASAVGFVGLGNMGMQMAKNLLLGGVPLAAFDSNRQTRDAAAEAAASASDDFGTMTVVSSAASLLYDTSSLKPGKIQQDERSSTVSSRYCNVVFTMLPGCTAVNSVMSELYDARQLQVASSSLPSSSLPLVIVDCSTVSPSTSRHWNERWEHQGVAFLDSPVSGGVKGATDATLTFMLGCQPDSRALATARPYLELMGQNIIPCGSPGAGSATKLCNNLALATQMVGVCEAMNLGEALGVDPVVLANVMNQSTARCWSSQVNNPHPAVALAKGSPASRDYDGGFAASLMLKDLGLAVAAGEGADVAMPLAATTKELYRLVRSHGMGGKDFGVMLKFLHGRGK